MWRPVRIFVFQDFLFLFLSLDHRAFAAFLASSLLSTAVRAAIRFFPPLPPAALPPFLPIARMTLEIRSRLIDSSYWYWWPFFGVDTYIPPCDTLCHLR